MLRVGPDQSNHLTVRVRAMSLVDVLSEPGGQSQSCGREPTLTSRECRILLKDLPRKWPCCEPLLGRKEGAASKECRSFQRPVTRWERLRMAFQASSAPDENTIREKDELEARPLLACLSGTTTECNVARPLLSLQDWSYTGWVEGLASLPDEGKTLACLSWAASAMQAHKGTGMSFTDAIKCAIEEGTLERANEYVVAMGDTTEQRSTPP